MPSVATESTSPFVRAAKAGSNVPEPGSRTATLPAARLWPAGPTSASKSPATTTRPPGGEDLVDAPVRAPGEGGDVRQGAGRGGLRGQRHPGAEAGGEQRPGDDEGRCAAAGRACGAAGHGGPRRQVGAGPSGVPRRRCRWTVAGRAGDPPAATRRARPARSQAGSRELPSVRSRPQRGRHRSVMRRRRRVGLRPDLPPSPLSSPSSPLSVPSPTMVVLPDGPPVTPGASPPRAAPRVAVRRPAPRHRPHPPPPPAARPAARPAGAP